jgi:hypothetical protein
VYGKRVFSIEKQVVGIMAGEKKKESGRESTESFSILLLTSEYILLLHSLITDKIGIQYSKQIQKYVVEVQEVNMTFM